MTYTQFNSRLTCPRCDVGLTDQDDGLHCKGCQTRYPLLDGIPFLFAEPGVALDEWRQRYHARLRDVEQQAQQLGHALAQPDLLDATRARLTHEQNALAAHSGELTALLASLDTTTMAQIMRPILRCARGCRVIRVLLPITRICIATVLGR